MKNPLRTLLAPAALVIACAFAGCAQQDHGKDMHMAMNTVCPVSGEALDAKSPTVDYMGHKVAFCCDKCVAKFEKMDAAGQKACCDKAMMKK